MAWYVSWRYGRVVFFIWWLSGCRLPQIQVREMTMTRIDRSICMVYNGHSELARAFPGNLIEGLSLMPM
jgi:hypothetical protein